MANQENDKQGYEFNTNKGTRMESAAEGEEQKDQRPEGGKDKRQTAKRINSNHQEGQYDKQNDDATMRPTSEDDKLMEQ